MAKSTLKVYGSLVELAGEANSLAVQLRDEIITKAEAETKVKALMKKVEKDLK